MLEFREQGGMFMPKDAHLHKLAVEYAAKNLARPINFTELRNVWVAGKVDSGGRPVELHGMMGMRLKADFPLVKFDHESAIVRLVPRVRGFLQDTLSARGDEAFIYIADKEDDSQRCPNFKKWLQIYGAEPAERWRLTI